jgi:hypothetical protein
MGSGTASVAGLMPVDAVADFVVVPDAAGLIPAVVSAVA